MRQRTELAPAQSVDEAAALASTFVYMLEVPMLNPSPSPTPLNSRCFINSTTYPLALRRFKANRELFFSSHCSVFRIVISSLMLCMILYIIQNSDSNLHRCSETISHNSATGTQSRNPPNFGCFWLRQNMFETCFLAALEEDDCNFFIEYIRPCSQKISPFWGIVGTDGTPRNVTFFEFVFFIYLS